MNWLASRIFGLGWWRIKEEVDRLETVSHEDPEELLPGSELSEADRHAALEQEAERLESEER